MTDLATDFNLNISENATAKIKNLMKNEEHEKPRLRIRIDGGGCSGFQYFFSFVGELEEDDIEIEKQGAKVVIDEVSRNFLNNCTLEYVEELGGSEFTISNPNASSSCGCGSSFSI
jgi:iron-sulfur cluster insertion protein